MARPREPWNIRPARKSRPVTASLKVEVETKANDLIVNVLKPRYVPQDRPANPPRWWSYPLAVVLPFPFVVLAAPVVLLREWLGIEFLPGV
jgi:hypothetical protein